MIMHNDCLPRAQSIDGIIENPNIGHGGYHRKFLSAKGGALCARKKPLVAAGRNFWRGEMRLLKRGAEAYKFNELKGKGNCRAIILV